MEVDRRRQILDAARTLFFRRGYHGVAMSDLGAALGMTGPALYKYFRSKDEILLTLFEEGFAGLTMAVEPMDDPHEELEALVRSHADFSLTERELVSVYTHEERSLGIAEREQFRMRSREHAAYWESVLWRCYPTLEQAVVVAAVQTAIGALHSVAYWPREALGTPNVHEALSDWVLGALRSLGEASRNGNR